jgi:hypothetical protein
MELGKSKRTVSTSNMRRLYQNIDTAYLQQIETFHDNIDQKLRKYVNPVQANHGYNGSLHVSVPEKELESEIKLTMDAGEELGASLTCKAALVRQY